MPAALRSFRNTWCFVSLLVCIGGLLYAYHQSVPATVAAALLAAILVEVSLYLVPGFTAVREALEARFSPRMLAAWMTVSAVIPYTIYTLPTGRFHLGSLAELALLAAVVAFWYTCLPSRPLVDLAFLCVMAGVVLSDVFSRTYSTPVPGLRVQFLGQLMWIRMGILSVLSIRRVEGTGFGFLPTTRDWKIGLRYFAYFAPVGVALSWALGFAAFHPPTALWWREILWAAGTLAGMLWVVALSEEFFFRGLLQQWLSQWLENRWAGLVIASLIFGLAHLPFRSFPNWRFAILAAVAGAFYGAAYLRAGSIRAPMVAHALVNTAWRVLFS